MDPRAIVDSFANIDSRDTGYQYLVGEGLGDILSEQTAESPRILPDFRDLARLHRAVRSRKAFTVLEFGIGYSTLVLSDAVMKNKLEWEDLFEKPRIRNQNLFEVHCVDASTFWIEEAKRTFLAQTTNVHIYYSDVIAGTFQDRICHYYENLPDIVPDFVYLDGPDPLNVKGAINGLSWKNLDRCVMAADILKMEPTLLPGTCVVIDGRTANAQFISSLVYRNWYTCANRMSDTTAMELQDRTLGSINNETLSYCLGNRIAEWNG